MIDAQQPPSDFGPIFRTSPFLDSVGRDFAGSAKIGDWIETRVDLQHLGRQLGFANAYLFVGDKRIVRASAVFSRAPESSSVG